MYQGSDFSDFLPGQGGQGLRRARGGRKKQKLKIQIEIKNSHINVWLNDDSSYVSFEFSTKDDRYLFEYFEDKWEEFCESESEEFLERPIKIYLDGDDEALKIDCTRFIDRPSADKKNPKFRLTDDDK